MAGHLNGTNVAQGVPFSDAYGGTGLVQIRSSVGGRDPTVWHGVIKLPNGDDGTSGYARAQAVASSLNAIFANTARDPDFLTPTYGFPNPTLWPTGRYGLCWTNVQNGVGSTSFTVAGSQSGYFYSGSELSPCPPDTPQPTAPKNGNQDNILWVQNTDQNYGIGLGWGDVPWDLALYWANQIRAQIDGVRYDGTALGALPAPNQNFAGNTQYTMQGYLAGEAVQYPTVGCGGTAEVAHTADLTISADSTIACGMWVRINLGGATVVVRRNDSNLAGHIEGTAGGVIWALGLGTACTTQSPTLVAP